MGDEIRDTLENSVLQDDVRRFGETEAFKYYVDYGGEPSREDTKKAGWSDDDYQRFNAAVSHVRQQKNLKPSETAIGNDIRDGLEEAGMDTESWIDDKGVRHTEIIPRR